MGGSRAAHSQDGWYRSAPPGPTRTPGARLRARGRRPAPSSADSSAAAPDPGVTHRPRRRRHRRPACCIHSGTPDTVDRLHVEGLLAADLYTGNLRGGAARADPVDRADRRFRRHGYPAFGEVEFGRVGAVATAQDKAPVLERDLGFFASCVDTRTPRLVLPVTLTAPTRPCARSATPPVRLARRYSPVCSMRF